MFECRKAKGAPQPEFRKCCACAEVKHAATEFFWSVQKTGTYPNGRCKACSHARQVLYRATRKKKYAEYASIARAKDPEKYRLAANKSKRIHGAKHMMTYLAKMDLRPVDTTKVCADCGLGKNAKADFYRYEQPCKTCHTARGRAHRIANPEKHIAKRKAYYEKTKEAAKRNARVWALKNPEKVKAQASARRKTEVGKMEQRERNWARRALHMNAIVPSAPKVTKEWFARLCQEHVNRCYYCWGSNRPLTADHVVALKSGGKHVRENILPSCKSCNSKKSDIPVGRFAPWVDIPIYGLELASA